MELNILSFLYLFLRLAPFILVSFFTFASILNNDFKGIIYLIGVLVACFITIVCSKLLSNFGMINITPNIAECNIITLNNQLISSLPLGATVISYSMFYILYNVIFGNVPVYNNIPSIIFFTLLIASDGLFNVYNKCYGNWSIPNYIISIGIGVGIGMGWAAIISKNGKNLTYMTGVNSNEICSKASNQTFKCKVYKNGNLIS